MFIRNTDELTGITKTEDTFDQLLKNLDKARKELFKETDYEKEYTEKELEQERKRIFIKEHMLEIFLIGIMMISMTHFLFYIIRIARATYYMDSTLLSVSILEGIFFSLLPIGVWIAATYSNEFSFENRRMGLLYFCVLNILAFIENLLQHFLMLLLIPVFLKIPISAFITKSMVINLARFFILGIPLLVCAFIVAALMKLLADESTKEMLLGFCIRDHVDLRKHKEFCYDAHFIRRLDNGDVHYIKQGDRSTHMLIDGTTGTGKTSSTLSVCIADDMDQKVFNETYQKKELQKAIEKQQVVLKRPITDEEFFLDEFLPQNKEGEKLLQFLREHVPTAGTTVLAPNAALADDVYHFAKARNLPVNRVDPTLDPKTGILKEGYIGFNPFYIHPELIGLFRVLEVVQKARVFADVLQALYEMNGKGDPYFTSLNRNITTCVTILILLTYPRLHKEDPVMYPKKQPTLIEFQEIIDSFDKAAPYAAKLRSMIENETDEQRGFGKDEFTFVLCLVENDLLGEGRDKMFDQARGLRTLVDEFLTNPLFRQILCSEDSVDMDRMLERGEITVVNYALELSRSDAVAFGLFFALSFNNAIKRRPEHTRIPHYYVIDEFPVLLHPAMEECFTLFRQYGVYMCVAIQTLDQMQKTDVTRYMRGVLLGNCSTHILFGRISPTEMKLYEEMAGTKKEMVEQETVSETALTMADTSKSFSVRSTPSDVPFIKGIQMRNRRFQEVTVFTVNEGSPLPPFFGKVFFLDTHKKLKRKTYTVDWSQYISGDSFDMVMKTRVSVEKNVEDHKGYVYFSNGEKIEEKQEEEKQDTGYIKKTGQAIISSGVGEKERTLTHGEEETEIEIPENRKEQISASENEKTEHEEFLEKKEESVENTNTVNEPCKEGSKEKTEAEKEKQNLTIEELLAMIKEEEES